MTNTATVSGGGEINTANNAASVTTALDPSLLSLSKRVRNVSEALAFGTVGEGAPGDVLEYCVTYRNVGSSPVTQVVVSDPLSGLTTPETAVADYGGGAVRWTTPVGAAPQYLSAAAGDDAGELALGALTLRVGNVAVGGGEVCFRVKID